MEKKTPTWDELLASLNTASSHPSDTSWYIYRYMAANMKEMESQQARTLLAAYMKLSSSRPSLIHSCMLGIAVKMSAMYKDFRFPQFLRIWGYDANLRPEDKVATTTSQSSTASRYNNIARTLPSLKDRVDAALASYMLHHPAEREETLSLLSNAKVKPVIVPMVAVKIFETLSNGRKVKSVKLVGADGMELMADSHQIAMKPWEIVGTLFDVLVRTSKEGNQRVGEIVPSAQNIKDVFPPVVGYVERYDSTHQHYHIFDNRSRHFVAENPRLRPMAGGFVEFAPIVPREDKFKSAVVLRNLSSKEGYETFGTCTAKVTYINQEKGYFYYKITSAIPPSCDGDITSEGSAQLSQFAGMTLAVGMEIKIIVFLTRGKDGKKRNRIYAIPSHIL